MSKLPQVSAKEILKVLYKLDFRIVTQKGSHIKLLRFTAVGKQKVMVPNHKEIRKGTLRNILREIDLSTDEFIKLLKH